MLPEFPELRGYGRLRAKTVEHGGHGDGMLRCGHLRGCFCTEWCHNFTLAVPAGTERSKSRLLACSFVRCSPFSELLVPSFRVSGAADADVGSPYGSMSMAGHRDLLLVDNHHRCYAVRSTNRLVYNIASHLGLLMRGAPRMSPAHMRAWRGLWMPSFCACEQARFCGSRAVGRKDAQPPHS